ncbi:MAG: TolB family protein [Bryobacterales bacterium]|nr:TolB family protein [Bryobacterales bacterium]
MYHLVIALITILPAPAGAEKIGIFEASADAGNTGIRGSAEYDARAGTYRVTGSGQNMWAAEDGFHFVYSRVSGDVSLTAQLEWAGVGTHAHRKGGPMFRATLDADSPYADFAFHGDGLLALQYRKVKGGPTAEVRTSLTPPVVARLERHGNVISAEVAKPGEDFEPVGALTVEMPESILAGLALSSHDNNAAATAIFSKVEMAVRGVIADRERVVESTLETIDVDTGRRRVVRRVREHFEAPNWSRDGSYLLYNSGGRIHRIGITGGEPKVVDTGERTRCNNDHGISPDGKWLAISDGSANRQSQVYIVPIEGGVPRLLTSKFPSYWHGWSPDGRTVAYCASRDGEFDIYTMAVEGGEEKRLTTSPGLDDGPDYSPDGEYIYFNSARSGLMRIWRMKADGSGQEMLIAGEDSADWFAHPSPDGKWIVYVSYEKTVSGHPANQDITLRLAPAGGGKPRIIATLFGGQGTMNVPSWSPDSRRVAFVSYRLVGR